MKTIRTYWNLNSSFVETNEMNHYLLYYLYGGGYINKPNINKLYKELDEIINLCILNIESRH